jgi:hypothetical protein
MPAKSSVLAFLCRRAHSCRRDSLNLGYRRKIRAYRHAFLLVSHQCTRTRTNLMEYPPSRKVPTWIEYPFIFA